MHPSQEQHTDSVSFASRHWLPQIVQVPKMLLLHMEMCWWWGSTNKKRKLLQPQKREAEKNNSSTSCCGATFQILHAVIKDLISSKIYFQALKSRVWVVKKKKAPILHSTSSCQAWAVGYANELGKWRNVSSFAGLWRLVGAFQTDFTITMKRASTPQQVEQQCDSGTTVCATSSICK